MDSISPASLPFKDRKGGLIFFGLATICLGGLCGLFVPLMIFASRMAPPTPNATPPPNTLSGAVMYGVLAVVLIWLGIGSIRARRWARALLAIWSWSWFALGLIMCAGFALMAPHFASAMQAAQPPGKPQLPAGTKTMIMVVTMLFMGFIFVLLPLIWGLFYSGRNVKATCEARDPMVRWTDRCPLPVLAASLWFGFGALAMLAMSAFHPVAPFFGLLLSGAAGTVFYLCLAAVWGYSTWAIYRLDQRGLWVMAGAMTLFMVSGVITYSRHDLSEVYTLMGYPAAQVEQIRAFGLMSRSTMTWATVICTLPWLGYLFYIRKFFPGGREAVPATAP